MRKDQPTSALPSRRGISAMARSMLLAWTIATFKPYRSEHEATRAHQPAGNPQAPRSQPGGIQALARHVHRWAGGLVRRRNNSCAVGKRGVDAADASPPPFFASHDWWKLCRSRHNYLMIPSTASAFRLPAKGALLALLLALG